MFICRFGDDGAEIKFSSFHNMIDYISCNWDKKSVVTFWVEDK